MDFRRLYTEVLFDIGDLYIELRNKNAFNEAERLRLFLLSHDILLSVGSDHRLIIKVPKENGYDEASIDYDPVDGLISHENNTSLKKEFLWTQLRRIVKYVPSARAAKK